jgi:hypothetical protein
MKKNIISIEGKVSEMSSSFEEGINIPIPADVKMDELIEGDKSPMFVTVEAVNEGKSANKRFYDQEVIMEIARQVNEKRPDAYLGHLSDSDRSTKRPEPQTIWLGSVVKKMNGKLRLFIKGYVLPEASKLRTYLKKAKSAGKNVAVSVYGQAKQLWDDSLDAYKLSNFNLESIDWVRSGSEGIKPAMAFQITSEMRKDLATREETIKEMTVGELNAINPSLVKAIQDEYEVKVAKEMQDSSEKEFSTIQEMVGENPVEKIAELQKTVAESIIDASLFSKVSSKEARKLIKSMVVKEMSVMTPEEAKKTLSNVLSRDEVVSIIQATGNDKINPLLDNRKKEIGRKYTKV